jgi:exportin-1
MPGNPLLQLIYTEFFQQIMSNHVAKMPKPKEVLIEVDESGAVVEVPYKDTESISLYETMKKTLTSLSILDSKKMIQTMLTVLTDIVFFNTKRYYCFR